MKDYHIYAHYVGNDTTPKTSPKKKRLKEPKTKVRVKSADETAMDYVGMTKKTFATGMVGANKITSYVGELTENTVTASRRKVGLAYTAMVGLGVANPMVGLVAAGSYTTDKIISYNIKRYKENLSADFIRQLSGGTVKTRG